MTARIGEIIGARIGTESETQAATLTSTITDSLDPVPINTTYTYSAVITNTSSTIAVNVIATIIADGDLNAISAVGLGWSIDQAANTFTCTRASLLPGDAQPIVITVISGSGDELVTSVASAIADNAAQSNLAIQDTAIFIPQTTLSVLITDSLDPVITVINYTYTAIVTNTGSNDATSVTATITLDSSLAFVSGSGAGWTVGAVGQVVTCTCETLAVGAGPAITITVTSGSAALTATSTADAIASNAPATVQVIQATVVKLVSRDTAGAFRSPASLTEWQNFNAYWVAAGLVNFPNLTPDSLYLCQESSGNLADSIGSLTLTVAGAPAYQQTVTNCTRKGIGFNGTLNQRCTAASGSGPNPTTTSTMWLWRIDTTSAPASLANVLMVSDGVTSYRLLMTTTPKFASSIAGVTNNGTVDPRSGSTMWADIQDDRTNLKSTCHTSQEKITNTFSASVLDGLKGLGGGTSWTGHAVYGVRFDGAKGEMSDAQIKALHTALNEGIAPTWT